MPDSDSIDALSEALVAELLVAGKTVSTAESCTGGWIAKSLTDNAGSSGCFGYGLVSYSNGAKESLLGVNQATLEEHGAVSEETVRAMADGVLNLSGADFAAAVSGVFAVGSIGTAVAAHYADLGWKVYASELSPERAARGSELLGDAITLVPE